MLAHGVDPALFLLFWGLVLVAFALGVRSLAAVLGGRTRRKPALGSAITTLACGGVVAWFAVTDGAFDEVSWFTFVVVVPLFLGVMSLVGHFVTIGKREVPGPIARKGDSTE